VAVVSIRCGAGGEEHLQRVSLSRDKGRRGRSILAERPEEISPGRSAKKGGREG